MNRAPSSLGPIPCINGSLRKRVTVHRSGSGSLFGRRTLAVGQTSNPKNVPDPFVCRMEHHPPGERLRAYYRGKPSRATREPFTRRAPPPPRDIAAMDGRQRAERAIGNGVGRHIGPPQIVAIFDPARFVRYILEASSNSSAIGSRLVASFGLHGSGHPVSTFIQHAMKADVCQVLFLVSVLEVHRRGVSYLVRAPRRSQTPAAGS